MRSDLPRGVALGAAVAACLLLLTMLAELWSARVAYPYDLEWMEGGMLAHGWRLQHGLPLYVRPNPDFVPYVYPPGYASLLAAFGSVAGLSPALGRWLSLVGAAVAAAGLGFTAVRSSGSWRAGMFAATAFVGTWQASGQFYDLVRPDTWFVALLVWSVALALEEGRATAVSAGLLLAAAFTMKHNAAVWGLPLAAWIGLRGGATRAALFSAAAVVPAALLSLRWQLASDGLFTTYLLAVPASHPAVGDRLWPTIEREVGNALPVPLALVVAWAWRRAVDQPLPTALTAGGPALVGMGVGWLGTYFRPEPPLTNSGASVAFFALGALPVALACWAYGGRRREELVLPLLLGGTTFAVAAAMRTHNGGYVNVLVPAYALLALGGAHVVGVLARAGRDGVVAGLIVAQVAWAAGTTDRVGARPNPRDLQAGERLVEALRDTPGPVLSPFAAWLPTYAGHPPSLHYMAVWDLDYEGNPLRPDLDVVRSAVADHYWSMAVGGNQKFGFGLAEAYVEVGEPLDPKARALMPKTGWMARPNRVMRARR